MSTRQDRAITRRLRQFNQSISLTESMIRSGMRVVCDDGFTCIGAGVERTIQVDQPPGHNPRYWIACRAGRHYLDGQVEDESRLVIGIRALPGQLPGQSGSRSQSEPAS